MSNLTINRIGPEAQADSAWHDEDIEASRFSGLDVRPVRLRGRDLFGAALAGLVALAGWLGVLVVFWVAATYTEWYAPASPWLLFWRILMAVTAVAPAILVIGGAVLWAYERWQYARRAAIVRDRLMNPVPASLIARMDWQSYGAIVAHMAALERDTAPYRAYRGVESLSLSASTAKPSSEEARKALESLAPALPVDPPERWIDEVLATEAHILLAGKTASGKTTVARALLARRIDAGDAICVIDPHAGPSDWHGVPAIGGGRDYVAISAALARIEAEMTARYMRRAAGEPVGDTITVLIDEVPAIASAVAEWRRIATRLGSEARKAGIRLIVISQSPLVEDMLLNSVMRRNFAIIALDMASIRLMLRDEPDAALRRAILNRLEGERWPALRDVQGQFRICDRTGLDRIRPARQPSVWRPVLSDAPASSAVRTDGRTDATLDRLAALIRAGVTREEARAQGYEFANDDWTRARREVEAETYLDTLLTSPASLQVNLEGGTQ